MILSTALRPPFVSPIRSDTNWIAVVNPKAGKFLAPEIYQRVKDQVGDGMDRYKTSPDREQRLRELTQLIGERNPSKDNPLGIIAMGGDGTINDSLVAILRHIFPNMKDLTDRPEDRVVDQMLESGIQLGAIRLGGANDLGANYGTPAYNVDDIMKYLDDSRLICLNMGAAILTGDTTPQIFCHRIMEGTTLAPSFEETKDERGMAAKWHRVRLGLANILKHRPVHIRWQDGEGVDHTQIGLEVLAHAAVKVAEFNGFPGTPQPGGLGVVVFPGDSRWKTSKIFREVVARGISARNGDPKRLLPTERLTTLSDPSLQAALQVSQERTFSFYDDKDCPTEEPVVADGDFLRRSHSMTIRALPPFPNFMTTNGSLMANLYNSL